MSILNSNLAPIGLSVYSRPEHLQKTISALKSDPLASVSELTVFSDAAAPGDEDAVHQVRELLKGIEGFKKVGLVIRSENDRVGNNRNGMRSLLNKHGKLIWLEEDIVIAPGFLRFMNTALDTYKQDRNIFSVCGYRPPISIPAAYTPDVFTLPRFCAWGFGIWKDRFDLIQMKIAPGEFKKFLLSPVKVLRFCQGGWDMLPMLREEVNGNLDALDVKIFYQQFLLQMQTVYPTRFLARNIGHDGTGMHCNKTSRFDVHLDTENEPTFSLPGKLAPNGTILKSNASFRSLSIRGIVRILILIVFDLLKPSRLWKQV